jgi:hypothetical protein
MQSEYFFNLTKNRIRMHLRQGGDICTWAAFSFYLTQQAFPFEDDKLPTFRVLLKSFSPQKTGTAIVA